VPAPIAGEYNRLGIAVREKRMTIEQALKELAQICIDRHEHFGLMLAPIVGETSYKFLYNELLMQVSNKYPGETRHQTALRYLRAAENNDGQGEECAKSALPQDSR
jgi:hypothetical protein